MSKPSPTNYPGYFQRYIDQVPETDMMTAFTNQTAELESFLSTISEERSLYAYAEGKWTIKELLQHIIDAERIFCFRALCFARGEKTSLPGFEENDYAANSHANERKWDSLVKEFLVVRQATELLFNSFPAEALEIIGIANNNPTSVSSIGFIIIGHYYHHKKVLLEKYL
jgi:uncharacterized damage-inducible protein DinB